MTAVFSNDIENFYVSPQPMFVLPSHFIVHDKPKQEILEITFSKLTELIDDSFDIYPTFGYIEGEICKQGHFSSFRICVYLSSSIREITKIAQTETQSFIFEIQLLQGCKSLSDSLFFEIRFALLGTGIRFSWPFVPACEEVLEPGLLTTNFIVRMICDAKSKIATQTHIGQGLEILADISSSSAGVKMINDHIEFELILNALQIICDYLTHLHTRLREPSELFHSLMLIANIFNKSSHLEHLSERVRDMLATILDLEFNKGYQMRTKKKLIENIQFSKI